VSYTVPLQNVINLGPVYRHIRAGQRT